LEPWTDDLDFDVELCPTGWATEALVIKAGVESWSAAAVFDHDD
jgi:hypothetical protein